MLSPSMDYEDYEISAQFCPSGDDELENGEDYETSSDEELHRALAYDPNQLSHSKGLPVNGHDFLKLVQEERKRLPEVVSAPMKSLPQLAPSHGTSARASNEQRPTGGVLDENAPLDELLAANALPSRSSHRRRSDSNSSQTNNYPDSETTTSEEPDLSVLDPNETGTTSMKEMKRQIRLKSLGCTPLVIPQRHQPARSSPTSAQDLIHRDQILGNFLSLRSRVDQMRRHAANGGASGDMNSDEAEKSKKGGEKNKGQARSRRRATSLIRIMNLGHPPQICDLLHKSQSEIHMTLEALVEQNEKAPVYSTLHADWIYALITVLRDPIEPDICSTLRRLAKLCIARRDNYEKKRSSRADLPDNESRDLVNAIEEEEYYGSLLITCIIRNHFGQADLR